MLSPITDAASAILEILKDRNIVLFVLMFAFWMLFYGIFRISTFKLTHLFGDDPVSKKWEYPPVQVPLKSWLKG